MQFFLNSHLKFLATELLQGSKLNFDVNTLFSLLLLLFSKFLILFINIIIAKIIIKILNNIVKKSFAVNQKISERKRETLLNISKSCIKYTVYLVVLCNVLYQFGVNITSLITLAGVGSVAIGLGSQSLIQDIITGMFILFEDQYGIGDIISIENFTGTVESITLRTTNLRSADGDLYIIPNGQVKAITNMSKEYNRASIIISVAYEENIDSVIKIMENELAKLFEQNKIDGLINTPVVLGIEALSESSVDIKIIADTRVGENWKVERKLRSYLKTRLDKEKISIPYPHRVVQVLSEDKNIKNGNDFS